ncbi:hypothetical protein ABI59_05535 [Acidobacteria bacterium Mor1]|nr:hypothetical protein ABI59_05535 [Acidobacteria bacterium Mor1]
MKHAGSLFFVLTGIWLVWSGHFNPLLIGFGLASVLLVLVIVGRMGIADHEGAPIEVLPRALTYAPWLLLEIAKANIDVVRVVLSPKMPISPSLFECDSTQKSDLGRTMYANSITLTPGTVTVEVREGRFKVHALTNAAADGVKSGEMDRRVTGVEGQA